MHLALRLHRACAIVFLAAVAAQAYTAGLAVFGVTKFTSHAILGYLTLVGASLLLALTLLARIPRPGRMLAASVLLLTILQPVLALAPRSRAPVLSALHPVNALLIFALAIRMARRATPRVLLPASEAPALGALILLLGLVMSGSAKAQSTAAASVPERSGRRAIMPRAREIALAKSAAPPAVSDSATVFVLTDRGWEEAVRGTNGVACHVNRSWLESVEPHCFDAEAAATIMPMEMRRTELLHQGRSPAEADPDHADGLAPGRFRVPRRPALSWMMSAAQRLISDDGRAVGAWRPHLMVYYPFLTAADLGLGANQDARGAILVDPGRPTANLMVIVRDFIEPPPAALSP